MATIIKALNSGGQALIRDSLLEVSVAAIWGRSLISFSV